MIVSKNILSPIQTKLLSVIVQDELNSGIVNVPPIEPIFCCGSEKYGFFGFFANFSKTEKFWKNFFGSEEAP
jgi:hypothetical protein